VPPMLAMLTEPQGRSALNCLLRMTFTWLRLPKTLNAEHYCPSNHVPRAVGIGVTPNV